MRYLGGKSRLAAKIVGEIRKVCPPPIHVYEPFCGGAAVTREFAEQGYTVSASDLFPGLCDMHRASCAGFRLPSGCTDEMRKAAKGKRDTLSVSSDMKKAVASGTLYETDEICQWLMCLKLWERIDGRTV